MMTDWSKVDWLAFDLEGYYDRLVRGVEWKPLLELLGIQIAQVRSTGAIYALCPFHNEKTPSCVFWPKSGRFQCHGCGFGGDKIDFALNFSGYHGGSLSEDFYQDPTGRQLLEEPLTKIELLFDSCRQKQVHPNQATIDFSSRPA